MNIVSGQLKTIREHDCLDWHTKVYGGSKYGRLTKCGVCNGVIDFLPKSYWQRVKNVFRGKFSY